MTAPRRENSLWSDEVSGRMDEGSPRGALTPGGAAETCLGGSDVDKDSPTCPLSQPARLWLDDVRPAPEGWTWCRSATEAYREIRRIIDAHLGTVEVSFDHDLGEGRLTGYDLAREIELSAHCGILPRIGWHVHSQNPVGAARIRAAMESADRAWSAREGGGR